MNRDEIEAKVDNYKQEYIRFMNLSVFPNFVLKYKELSVQKCDTHGFEPFAQVYYDFEESEHILTIATDCEPPKYLLFHEFTHILDDSIYMNNDKKRYKSLTGFTEYHASQIELLQLLGTDNIREPKPFSVDNTVCTVAGKLSVYEYVYNKYCHAIELFNSESIFENEEHFNACFGCLFVSVK